MSSTTSSPAVEPLHQSDKAAKIQAPQTSALGNSTNIMYQGGGQKALLAKKMAKSNNPSTISPTDNMMTPCTAKLTQAKKKHFTKAVKALSFAAIPGDDEDEDSKPTTTST